MQIIDQSIALDLPNAAYKRSEAYLKAGYAKQAHQYRQDDEIEVTTEHHRHLCAVIESLCTSFNRPIRVLDAGCGTGRYFHCVRNAEELVGVDLSSEMLEAARTPVRAEHISTANISLVCGNIFEMSFPYRAFDFIYSIGMFALGCPLTPELCGKFYDWLAPDGRLFFNVTDREGIARAKLFKRRVRKAVYRFAPKPIKNLLDNRALKAELCALTGPELAALMRETPFDRHRIISQPCHSPLWRGRHLECLAWKHDIAPRRGTLRTRTLPVGF